MLKWFRKYNKYILAIGASVLMIAFLIPQSLQMLGRGGQDYVIGKIGEEEIRIGQQRQAAFELRVLSDVFGGANALLPRFLLDFEPAQWMLMKVEARQMGVSAGDQQAASLLAVLAYDEDRKDKLIRDSGLNIEGLYDILAQWISVETYRLLISGRSHLPIEDRLNQYVSLLNQMRDLDQAPPYLQQIRLGQILAGLSEAGDGVPRLSEPVMQRTMADLMAQVTIQAVPLRSDRHLDDVPVPDEAQITALYEQYQDNLPGESEPYGFGYKFPDRVKVEYVSIPFDRVVAATRVEETEAVDYYDQHLNQFTVFSETEASEAESQPAPKPKVKRYPQVRQEIIDQLKREKAQTLARQIVRKAQSLLQENLRSVVTKDKEGYRVLPEDWKPVSMEEVAGKLQEQYGVLPSVKVLDDRWTEVAALGELSGIGPSSLPNKQRTDLVSYVSNLRELGHVVDGPRLQAGLPSATMNDIEGSSYVFRVIEAAKTRAPASLDEVREQVVSDARRLAAYEKLKGDEQTWAKRLEAATSMDDVAKQVEVTVIEPAPFPRRRPSGLGTAPEAPIIRDIGQSKPFVDAVFGAAYSLTDLGAIAQAPIAKRSLVIPNDADLTVYLVRLIGYEPMNRKDYEQYAAMREGAYLVDRSLTGTQSFDPFSFDALKRRTGYVEHGSE